ncbi:MAG: twin-arginine translocase TatA/TatE family subunit [Chloroflexi bacterium]|nr:twin-arginine translocase TatA/TatE family subunit [Chloroflexota bacterium]
MNLFGVGNMEIAFVLIVAAIVLGPARVVDVARQAGSTYRKARRMLREIADTAMVKMDEQPASKAPPRDPVPGPEDAVSRGSDTETDAGAGKAE